MKSSWRKVNKAAFTFSVFVVVFFVLGSLILWLIGWEWAGFMRRWVWPIAMAGVVGYFTNYIAIQMLFLPYRPDHRHWLSYLTLGFWREGIVPARKKEIAQAAGQQIAEQILTHDRISKEIVQVAERVLDDEELRRRIRTGLGPVLRQIVPFLIDRLTPEIVASLVKAAREGVRRDNIVAFVDKVLTPWLATEEVRDRGVDLVTSLLVREAPRFERILRAAAEKYSQTSLVRRLAYKVSEFFGLVDWNQIQNTLRESFSSPETRREIYDFIGTFLDSLSQAVRADEDLMAYLSVLTERLRVYLSEQVELFLKKYLPEIGGRLVDSPALWHWLAHEAVPQLRPHLLVWLNEQGGSQYLAKQFDIAGRVSEAVHELQVEKLHNLVNEVSGNELGAVQVLGLLLGAVAGGLMALALGMAGG